MQLDGYTTGDYAPGASWLMRALWYSIGSSLLASRFLPFSNIRRTLLRLFGAQIGVGVVIRPGTRVKYPWRLAIGDHSWIGESVWIDNLDHVAIGDHCCVSQGAFLCTGNHDWTCPRFSLRVAPITIRNRVWIGAQAKVGPGVTLHEGTVLSIGSVVTKDTGEWEILSGNPARPVGRRQIRQAESGSQANRIVLINDSYPPQVTATGQYLEDLAEYLSMTGWNVTVLVGHRSQDGVTQDRSQSHVKVIRTHGYLFDKPGKFGRAINSLLATMRLASRLLTLPAPHAILCLSSPPFAFIPLGWIARLRRIPFVPWIMDLNPDQSIAAGWLSQGSIAARSLNFLVKNSLQKSSIVFTLDDAMRARIHRKIAHETTITVMPLWIPPPLTVHREIESAVIVHGSNRRFRVMYAGNISICHPIETLLAAAQHLRDDDTIEFVFVGHPNKLQSIEEFRERHALSNITTTPFVSRPQLPSLLTSADLHFVSFGDQFVGVVHPSKIYGIIGVGRPFILLGPDECFIKDRWVTMGLGTQVRHGEVTKVVEIIRQYQSMSDIDRATLHELIVEHARQIAPEVVLPRVAAELACILPITRKRDFTFAEFSSESSLHSNVPDSPSPDPNSDQQPVSVPPHQDRSLTPDS